MMGTIKEKILKSKFDYSEPTYIWIPGNVPSSKNSKIACAKGVFHSKTVRQYLQALGIKAYKSNKGRSVTGYKTKPNLFAMAVSGKFKDIEYPLIMGFHFVRGSRHKFDFVNAVQIIADLLVAHGCIDDDDMDHLIPEAMRNHGGVWYSYDKERPGVYLRF